MSVEYLEAGWKSYSSAEIGEVLANCRKALEEVGKYVIKQGFVIKEKQFDKKEKQVMVRGPDWKKFLGSENKGDMIGTA